jgi:hypothetical protein
LDASSSSGKASESGERLGFFGLAGLAGGRFADVER